MYRVYRPYLIYDNFYGSDMGNDMLNMVPSVTPSGIEKWLAPITLTDNISSWWGNRIYNDVVGTHMSHIHTGQTDFTVGMEFTYVHAAAMCGALGCRFDSDGDNGYLVGVINTTTTPEVHIYKITL